MRPRAGVSLFEFIAAAVVLSLAMTLGMQLLVGNGAAAQTARDREQLLLAVGNLAERVQAAGYSVTAEQAAEWVRGPELTKAVPNAQWTMELRPIVGPPAVKTVVLRCVWQDRRGTAQPALQASVVLHAPTGMPKAARASD